ncbi:hypothetical protein J6590_069028 [Homalodisca vitripennis]|nr:hypothetical protein J6590_069028 [Homalodisca vitripennis]
METITADELRRAVNCRSRCSRMLSDSSAATSFVPANRMQQLPGGGRSPEVTVRSPAPGLQVPLTLVAGVLDILGMVGGWCLRDVAEGKGGSVLGVFLACVFFFFVNGVLWGFNADDLFAGFGFLFFFFDFLLGLLLTNAHPVKSTSFVSLLWV